MSCFDNSMLIFQSNRMQGRRLYQAHAEQDYNTGSPLNCFSQRPEWYS